MIIREATHGDMAEIHRIYAHHVLHGAGSFEEAPPSVETMVERFDLMASRKLPWLVADIDGVIAGYCYANRYHERSAYRFTLEDAVYIAPDRARSGIGHALLTEILARATAGGYRQMVAVIGDSENYGSIGLHRALGFRRIGTLQAVGFKFGRWLDSVIMQKELGA